MDLWIRSQDREILVKCNDISIAAENKIVGFFDKETEYEILGIYKTKERALEVLNSMQKSMMTAGIYNGLGEFIRPVNFMIYEMPKE